MTKITLDQIKKLRTKTKAGVMDCRQALRQAQGKLDLAEKILRQWGVKSAGKRADRQTACGVVEAYSHTDGRIVAVVELCCETDFVARNDEFKKLAHELAMQVAAMKPKNISQLLKQLWIRDEKRTVDSLVKEAIGKIGENIVVRKIARFELGEE
ncbi:MAG: elongation factor T [Microgenomates group bacterium LiPW_31]|nr:MAG: elongation factor T [Microgenomates group bacterium LiPW_31]